MGALKTFAKMVSASWMPGLAAVQARLMGPYYRAVFLASAARCGLLTALAGNRSLTAQQVIQRLGADTRPDLVAPWLDFGVASGVLRRDVEGRFRLRAIEARLLARDVSGVGRRGCLRSSCTTVRRSLLLLGLPFLGVP